MVTQLTDTDMYKILQACAVRLRENPDDPEALFFIGAIYARIGKLRASMKYLERLSSINENYPGIWRLKAGIFRRMGDEETSEACLTREDQSDLAM
jgi:tetratricopeptide (TPR) repeat protein